MKTITLLFLSIALFTNALLAQKPNKPFLLDIGIYKVSTILGNESTILGYYYFKNDNQYDYFGNATYNVIGKFGNYYTFTSGIWKISKDSVITAKDEISNYDNALPSKIPDSIIYNAAYRMPYDSIFFDIQVFGDDGTPLRNEVIEIRPLVSRLLETDEVGKIKFQAKFSNSKNENQIEFLGQEPFYQTSITVLSRYNYHQLKVYLKKIPDKGFLPTRFIPKNWNDKIQRVSKDTFRIGKYLYLTKASPMEVKPFINKIENANPYFQSDFNKIKKTFRVGE